MIIGLDIGGTNTDVVLLGYIGIIREAKIPTDQSNLYNSVLKGLEKITGGIALETINRIVFSTTLTTNAIAQNKIMPVGMILLSGPGIDPYEFKTGENFYLTSGYIDHRGREIESINTDEIKNIAKDLISKGIRYVGVVGKFSVRNPSHELKIKKILADSFEKVFLGHEVSGNLNFPRRIATTYLNASVYPIHKQFFEAVKKSLESKGLKVPINILKADGGTMSLDASIRFPAQTILSGPAASVMGAIPYASDKEDTIVLDIGGTTTDMAVLINKAPVLDANGIEIMGYKTLIRSLAVQSIPIGGDSVVKVKNGSLEIGPERLGPAIVYGGQSPTPTDALVVLGKIENIAKDKSIAALKIIAKDLSMTVEDTALEIIETTCKTILNKAFEMVAKINSKPVYTVHELKEGHTVNPKKILVLGGPSPYFVEFLKNLSNMDIDFVPKWHVANAIGAALAKTTCEVTLFADTEQGKMTANEEGFSQNISRNFSKKDAINKASELLCQKALMQGASLEDFSTEIIEELQFNMVRGFYTSGKNIRIKVQVKPGLIQRHHTIKLK